MRRLIRSTTAGILALGLMGPTVAVAAPSPANPGAGQDGTAEVAMRAYPWICRVMPRLPFC